MKEEETVMAKKNKSANGDSGQTEGSEHTEMNGSTDGAGEGAAAATDEKKATALPKGPERDQRKQELFAAYGATLDAIAAAQKQLDEAVETNRGVVKNIHDDIGANYYMFRGKKLLPTNRKGVWFMRGETERETEAVV